VKRKRETARNWRKEMPRKKSKERTQKSKLYTKESARERKGGREDCRSVFFFNLTIFRLGRMRHIFPAASWKNAPQIRMGTMQRMHNMEALGLCRKRFPAREHKLQDQCFRKTLQFLYYLHINPIAIATCVYFVIISNTCTGFWKITIIIYHIRMLSSFTFI
jgi:hypothetical protein